MIYELMTYDLRPRTIQLAELSFAKAYRARGESRALVGSFHTEFGPLNQIIQIWCYESLDHREADSGESSECWTADSARHVVAVKSELMVPVSFSPVLARGSLGPYFELRTYTYPMGMLGRLLSAWERAMPIRNALGSPVAAIWTASSGALCTLTHIWPYKTLGDREDIRKKVRESGKWPPFKLDEAEGGNGYEILTQQNKLMLPAAFSPLQ